MSSRDIEVWTYGPLPLPSDEVLRELFASAWKRMEVANNIALLSEGIAFAAACSQDDWFGFLGALRTRSTPDADELGRWEGEGGAAPAGAEVPRG